MRQLLLGQIASAEAAPLEEHLLRCHHCAAAARGLDAEDWLLRTARAEATALEDPERELVESLMTRLEGLLPAAEAPEADAKSPAVDDLLPAALLAPPQGPGELGRLGPYRVLQVIGAGGMGVVFEAEDPQLGRRVALKVMSPRVAARPAARERFVREARAMAALEHDHVVTVYQAGEADGVVFLAMQLLRGEALEERLRREGRLPLGEVLRIGREVAEALAAAHAAGLVHRDVKPGNLWLEAPRGRVKVLDFGLAWSGENAEPADQTAAAACEADTPLTGCGAALGTPAYMAPEQAAGRAVDARTDLYALGCVLYRACTGALPFPGRDTKTALRAPAPDRPRPLQELNPGVPRPLAELVLRLLASDPGQRPPTARAVADALAALERQRGRTGGRWRLVLSSAAAVLLLAVGALGLSEATGVTQLAATVIRILTPEGTLIVAVDDPAVKVTIEGDGGQAITGAGPQEVRLPPGSYRLQASKDGKPVPVSQELVTISRGDRQVVKVGLEGHLPVPTIGETRRFLGHTDIVWCVAFSSDRHRALSAGFDGCVRVWDVETGQEQRRFEGHKGPVWAVAVSPDGRLALSGSGGKATGDPPEEVDWSVCLWEVDSGKELRRTEGRGWGITSVAFSPDGRRALLGHYEGPVCLWDVEEWKEIRCFDHKRNLWSVCFSPGGHSALTAGGWEGALVSLWDLDSGRELRQFDGDPRGYFQAVFSPDGRSFLAGGCSDNVTLWDVETGKVIRHFPHKLSVLSVAFSPDGRYAASGGDDTTVRLWHVATGEERLRMQGHREAILTVAFSSDGRHVLSGGKDRTVRLWRLPP